MVATTIVAGGNVLAGLTVDSTFATLADVNAALAAIINPNLPTAILTSASDTVPAGYNVIYNIAPSAPFTVPGGAEGAVLVGTSSANVTTNGGTDLIIGNYGNDTINAMSGSGTIIVSNASSVINLAGSYQEDSATANYDINMYGGSVTIGAVGGSAEKVDLYDGDNSVSSGISFTANLIGGNDTLSLTAGSHTINLGSGADTITEAGSATIYGVGSTASLMFTATGSGKELVDLGAGSATLIGGAGTNTFVGGIGTASMTGGAGSNIFTAGTGADTMVGVGSSNLFNFATTTTTGGASYVVDNFVGSDTIHVTGYTSTQVLANATFSGGNTVISLGGGSTITLVGFQLSATSGHFG
jgi:Ca2+-binding RTX toxin-like protein